MQKSLTSLTPGDLANLLQASGSRTASPETIARDIASGAPVNADGTLHFLHYVTWLLKEQHHGN